MNNRGQVEGIGLFIGIFITVIIGLVLLTSSAQTLSESTATVPIVNQSLGVADNATTVYMANIKSLSGVVIYNESGTEIVPANNYTVTNNVINGGELAVSVLPDGSNDDWYQGYTWTISGTGQPLGYIPEGGARSIAGLIIIFFALAVMIVALLPAVRSKIFEGI